jgi:four helix bundle protein
MKENLIVNKVFSFALKTIDVYKHLTLEKKEFVMSKQLLRSGTSIGANVNEAEEAQSLPDFIHKMSIALKEARETQYWIKLLSTSGYLSEQDQLIHDLDEIISLLTVIIKTSKERVKKC